MLINLATCCRPIYDDKVIGFFSPGRGVVVHRIHCKNTREYKRKHKNWLNVQWADNSDGGFSSDIKLILVEDKGVLAQIAGLLSESDCNIENVKLGQPQEGTSSHVITISVRNRKHLARVMRRLHNIESVLKIERVRN